LIAFFKYNNHHPGVPIQKDYFIFSKNLTKTQKIESIIPKHYFKFKEYDQNIIYKLK